MKRFAKLTAAALCGVLVLSGMMVFANETYNGENDDYQYENESNGQYYDEAEAPVTPAFLYVAGRVTEINPVYGGDGYHVYGQQFIKVQDQNGATTVFHTDYNTYVLGEEVAVGDNIKGFYASGGIAPAIYPPRYTVQLIVNGEFENVRIDRFHVRNGGEDTKDLISAAGDFVLRFTDETPIKLQDGQDFRVAIEDRDLLEALDGRLLVVTYGPTTRSMPPITVPGNDPDLKVVVLFERAVAHPGEIDYPNLDIDWPPYSIVVEGQRIEGEWTYIGGAYFVPFRAVVDALGHGESIYWNGQTRTITVNNGEKTIVFTVGATHYYVDGEIVYLPGPSVIINDRTYVPFRFFDVVFGLNNAYHFEGQVVINNKERME